jgi:hypothetical protein
MNVRDCNWENELKFKLNYNELKLMYRFALSFLKKDKIP